MCGVPRVCKAVRDLVIIRLLCRLKHMKTNAHVLERVYLTYNRICRVHQYGGGARQIAPPGLCTPGLLRYLRARDLPVPRQPVSGKVCVRRRWSLGEGSVVGLVRVARGRAAALGLAPPPLCVLQRRQHREVRCV